MTTKSELRRELVARRKKLTKSQRERANAMLIDAALAQLAPRSTVAAYYPVGSEPGGPDFVPALAAAVDRLYLPISLSDGQLAWTAYTGEMAPGAYGIPEPVGPRLDSSVLRECDVIFVPALAISPDGVRLGKGAGYYDRALANLSGVRLVGMVYEHELRDDVPGDPHDVPVNKILVGGNRVRLCAV